MRSALAVLRTRIEPRRLAAAVTRWIDAVLPGATLAKANFKEAASSLAATGARSALALTGIAVGIGAVIAMVSTGEVVKEESLKQFRALGTDVLTIRKAFSEAEAPLSRAQFTALPTAVPAIAAATPWMSDAVSVAYRGVDVGRTDLFGVVASFAELQRLTVAEGRFISDLDRGQHFCVLGDAVARKVRAGGAVGVVGEDVRVYGRLCTVIGALAPHPGSVQTPALDDAVLVPMAVTARAGEEIEMAIARLAPGADPFAAARQVGAYFRRVSPDANMVVVSARQLIDQMQRQARMFTLLFAAIGTISLIVGGIGVMNVMLMSVTERRAEIGVRRAIGARRRDVAGQFLTESAVLCLVGGTAGIVLGTLSAWGISRFAGWSFFVSGPAVLLGFGVSTAVGLFFGFYPARQAARLDPIAALRA